VLFLKRDYDDPNIIKRMSSEEALDYLVSHDFCNPHQLVRDERRMRNRTEFFRKYLSECDVLMVNTTCPAEETQERIREALSSL